MRIPPDLTSESETFWLQEIPIEASEMRSAFATIDRIYLPPDIEDSASRLTHL
jgi:hypothetical protein